MTTEYETILKFLKSNEEKLKVFLSADEKSKDICKRLINLEEKLTVDIRKYL